MKTKHTIAPMLFFLVSMLSIDVYGENLWEATNTSEFVQQQKKIMTEKGWTLKVEKTLTVLSTGIWQSNLFHAKSGKRYTAQIVSSSASIKGAEFAIAPQGDEASSVLKSDGGFPGAITYAGGVESSSGNLIFLVKIARLCI